MAFSEYRAQILNFLNFILNLKKFFLDTFQSNDLLNIIFIQCYLSSNPHPQLWSPMHSYVINVFFAVIQCMHQEMTNRSLGIPQCTTPDPSLSLWPYHLFLFPLSIFCFLCSYLSFFFPPWSWPQHHPSFACVYSWRWHPYMAAYLIVFSF